MVCITHTRVSLPTAHLPPPAAAVQAPCNTTALACCDGSRCMLPVDCNPLTHVCSPPTCVSVSTPSPSPSPPTCNKPGVRASPHLTQHDLLLLPRWLLLLLQPTLLLPLHPQLHTHTHTHTHTHVQCGSCAMQCITEVCTSCHLWSLCHAGHMQRDGPGLLRGLPLLSAGGLQSPHARVQAPHVHHRVHSFSFSFSFSSSVQQARGVCLIPPHSACSTPTTVAATAAAAITINAAPAANTAAATATTSSTAHIHMYNVAAVQCITEVCTSCHLWSFCHAGHMQRDGPGLLRGLPLQAAGGLQPPEWRVQAPHMHQQHCSFSFSFSFSSDVQNARGA